LQPRTSPEARGNLFGTANFAPIQAQGERKMAKGQMRSNKEAKKPKAKKPAASPATSNLKLKGSLTPVSFPKKG
jgi:hypothetical protein